MEESQQPNRKLWASVLIFIVGGVPAIILRITDAHVDPIFASLLYGLGIVAGAFLLSWAAEVAQMDVSASFAIAVLALVAVLPEYAIEVVLAWQAGASFDPATAEFTDEMGRVAANVTGSNRLLIGLGWSLVILIYWLKRRDVLDMRGSMSLEMAMIVIATAMTAIIFIFGQVPLLLAVALILLFAFYLWKSSTSDSEEPELVGVARLVGALPPVQRRAVAAAFLVYAAGIILIAAEPFVDGLVETGAEFGIDEFILIQWIAPLASESPEIIVAILFSLRSNPTAGLTTLISAEVNQLTLLVGSMVVLFSWSAGELLNFPLDDRQSIEFMLTTAVSIFAILLIAPRVLHWWMGALLLILFIAHLFFPDQEVRRIFAFMYFGLAAALVVTDLSRVVHLATAIRDQIRLGGKPAIADDER
jgi:cation:H+ antiporter